MNDRLAYQNFRINQGEASGRITPYQARQLHAEDYTIRTEERAMAGINGNSAARIYCQKIEAELLAIDGFYRTAEEFDAALRNRPAQAWLEGETLRITPLN